MVLIPTETGTPQEKDTSGAPDFSACNGLTGLENAICRHEVLVALHPDNKGLANALARLEEILRVLCTQLGHIGARENPALLELLLARGASIEHKPGEAVRGCIANGCPDAAEFLAATEAAQPGGHAAVDRDHRTRDVRSLFRGQKSNQRRDLLGRRAPLGGGCDQRRRRRESSRFPASTPTVAPAVFKAMSRTELWRLARKS